MSNTVVKEKAKKTEAVVVAYTGDSSVKKFSKSTPVKSKNLSNMNVLAKKTAKMKAILAKFPLPAGN
ncbi:hypothetical protein Dfri01_58510 [Dyadobacter frigoris]|uniref:hypothetical protein n=1 Tax=Dyadobacter frigoris TaxID=2576211 RepID=UPI0024A2FFA2|nr:hypothetical protein [Dyadobacter frigoris]GLU56390.1 hypothetical protein Dfri01_58510 [Dyadobacter frigoris]